MTPLSDGPKFDDRRLAELKQEVDTLCQAVLEASRARLAFDDEPAAFASLMAKDGK